MLNKLLPLFSKKSGFYSSNDFSARLLDNASMTEILFNRPLSALELIDVNSKGLKSADFNNTFIGSANDTDHFINTKELEFCALAMAKQDVRYYLQGLCLNVKTNGLCGTDGHRLHFVGALPTAKEYENEAILPAFFINAVLRVAKAQKVASVRLVVSENRKQVFCSFDNLRIVANCIDGNFPDVARVVPLKREERGTYAPFNKGDLALLKKVIKTSKHKAVIFDKDKTLLNGENSDLIATIKPCITLDTFKMGFNLDYLIDINPYFESGDWQALNENAVLMVSKNQLTALVMPLRV